MNDSELEIKLERIEEKLDKILSMLDDIKQTNVTINALLMSIKEHLNL